MASLDRIEAGFRPVGAERLRIEGGAAGSWVAVDPASLQVEVAPGAEGRLLVLHRTPAAGPVRLTLTLAEGARLSLVQLFAVEADIEVCWHQAAASASCFTTVQLTSASLRCRTELDGRGAESLLQGLFIAGSGDRCAVSLDTRHNVPDCRSHSTVKGVAGGTGCGRFDGLVYVAPDAQRTDARQQSRNVLLSDTARIDTLPQLEIYADDVQCTHGATVGQMDDEAIFYMRQRGLSEAAARCLQIEGFAADVLRACGDEALAGALMEAVTAKMKKLEA